MTTASTASSVTRLRPPQAAEYLTRTHGLPVAVGTLNKRRCIGGGPRFRKMGRAVFYDATALDQWASEVLSGERKSTSDRAAAREQKAA